MARGDGDAYLRSIALAHRRALRLYRGIEMKREISSKTPRAGAAYRSLLAVAASAFLRDDVHAIEKAMPIADLRRISIINRENYRVSDIEKSSPDEAARRKPTAQKSYTYLVRFRRNREEMSSRMA